MKDAAQFVIRGGVTQIQDMVTLKGASVVQLAIASGGGGDAARPANAFRVDIYDANLQAVAHQLQCGQNVQCSGRLTGRLNDRGYFNYALYADALLVEPAAPAPAPMAQPRPAPQPMHQPPYQRRADELADEDIPF